MVMKTTIKKTMKTTKVLPVRQPLKREPTHPGEILREDVLPALRMNVSQAARELGVTTAPAPNPGGEGARHARDGCSAREVGR